MREIAITHTDLDGAASYTVLNWCLGRRIPVKAVTMTDFKPFWKNSLLPNIDTFDNIYITDLSVGPNIDLFDFKNVTIFDHHEESILNSKFLKAKPVINECTSAAKLIYNKFKPKLSNEQKLLVALVDDYDSYQNKIGLSKLLNYLYWGYQGDRVSKFYDDFKDGFKGFNKFQKNIIRFYIEKLIKTKNQLQAFSGDVIFNDKKYSIIATFSDFATNDIADFILKKTSKDICAIVNLNSNKVSFRKQKNTDCNLSEFAKFYANGGGHIEAAGGILTDAFINVTKYLLPYEL